MMDTGERLLSIPVHVSPLMPKDTAIFVQNGEIVSKLHRLVTDAEEERIAAAVAAERARMVAIVDEAETRECQRYEKDRDSYSEGRMDALSSLMHTLTAAARGTDTTEPAVAQ